MEHEGTVYILGGSSTVSNDMEAKIKSSGFENISRMGGEDRYETSLRAAENFNLPGEIVCTATVNNFPDTLAGSIYAALYIIYQLFWLIKFCRMM